MVSVIIPTLNASKYLPDLLDKLGDQTVREKEIIVIDSSSNDDTITIAESYLASVICIDRKDFDHGRTRNLAATRAKGDVLVYLTQDVVPFDKYFLENLLNPLNSAGIIASYGRQLPKEDAIPPERFARLFNYPDKPLIKSKDDLSHLGIKTFFFSNVCSAIKRKAFEQLGMFPENVIMDEDLVFAAQSIMKGYKIAYVPEARVLHSHNYSPVQQFNRYFDVGVILNRERWILELTSAEGEGLHFIREEAKFLYKNKKWLWIPYAMVQAMAKFTGYRLGLMEHKMPVKLKRRLSMHKYFWNKAT